MAYPKFIIDTKKLKRNAKNVLDMCNEVGIEQSCSEMPPQNCLKTVRLISPSTGRRSFREKLVRAVPTRVKVLLPMSLKRR